MSKGANEFSMEELEELFKGEGQETPPAEGNKNPPETPPNEPTKTETNVEDVTKTQAFARRLKEEKEKALKEARQEIAASLGYASYEELQKSKEKKMLEEQGLDPEQVSPIVEKLVEERLSKDPRMQELEELRKAKVNEFASKELKEINDLVGTNYTSVNDIPKDVIEDWRKTGSLKKSYIALHGEELILKAKSAASKGTTSHLQTPGGSPGVPTNRRPLNEEERAVWRLFNPNITDEELNKKFKEI